MPLGHRGLYRASPTGGGSTGWRRSAILPPARSLRHSAGSPSTTASESTSARRGSATASGWWRRADHSAAQRWWRTRRRHDPGRRTCRPGPALCPGQRHAHPTRRRRTTVAWPPAGSSRDRQRAVCGRLRAISRGRRPVEIARFPTESPAYLSSSGSGGLAAALVSFGDSSSRSS